jgi:DNA-binding winged helix-turn-helix (wHTH) protein/TolB-like protein/Tfp pilus assembly protein PilF
VINSATKTHFFDFGIFRLDPVNRELLKDGEHIALTQKSFEILYFLIKNRGKMLKKDEILHVVWTESYVEEANLAQHIYMIRKVLKDNGDKTNYIETIPKYGYRFVGEVKESFAAPEQSSDIRSANGFQPPTDVIHNNGANGFSNGNGHRPEKKPAEMSAAPDEDQVEQIPARHSHLFSNIIFAGVFGLIILAFVFSAYISMPAKQTDISSIRSISILPFKQIGGNKDEKLGLGVADTLISRLSNQNKISILPTATIADITEEDADNLTEIGERLDVDAILTGTIQKDREAVRVNVQLISVRDGTPLWTDKFDAKFSDIFSLQDKVSEQLARKLSIELKDSPRFDPNDRYAKSREAAQEYTLGLSYWNNRSSDNLPKAIGHFEKAVAKDDKFADAYAHLADAYSLVAYYRLVNIMPSEQAAGKARELAKKALTLNSGLSEAYTALAMVAVYEDKKDEAIKLYRQAINLKPANATAHSRLAWLLTTQDNLDEAIKEMRLAQKADPQSPMINANLASLLRLNRQTDEALDYCRKAIEIDPSKVLAKVILAEIYEQKGLFDKSIEELKSVPKNAPEEKTAKLLLSRVYAKKGEKTEARKILLDVTEEKSEPAEISSYEVATVYTHLGEKAEAVEKLKKSKEDSLMYFLHLKYDYNIDPLRNTPEYSKILSQSKSKVVKNTDKKS